MAYRKKRSYVTRKKRSYTKKKRSYARKKRVFGRNVIPRSVNSAIQIPNMYRLRYHEDILLSTGTVPSLNWHAFSANGLFDPNITGTGHQPMLFDQLAVFWNRYTVLGSKITIKVVPNTSTNPTPGAYCGITLDDNNTLNSANESSLIENGKGAYRFINPSLNGSTPSTTLTSRFSARKFFNKSSPSDDDTISATFVANPADQAYYLIWVSCPQTVSSIPFNISVTIDYIVRCHEPRDTPQS